MYGEALRLIFTRKWNPKDRGVEMGVLSTHDNELSTSKNELLP